VDPSLLNILARVKNKADLAYVRDAIQAELASLRTRPADPARLEAIRSSLKYGFASALDSTESAAGVVVEYVAATRDVSTLNEVYRLYDAVTAADIQRVANKYFVDQGMIVTTLANGEIDAAAKTVGGVDKLATAATAATTAAAPAAALALPAGAARPSRAAPRRVGFKELVQRTSSPLVDMRLVFRAGSADDPPGKEGLATLTARMVTQAGSRALTYQQIQQALFPMAAGFGASVDKEMTTFAGKVHRDNAERWYDIIAGQLLDPGFRPEDFTRVKTSLINNIRVDLRGNNDEELGNEVLYEQLYAGHPYGHLNMGWAPSVEKLTLEDVRAFHKAHYTQANLTMGVAGGVSEAFVAKARADLAAALPVGAATRRRIPPAKPPQGLDVTIVQKPTAAAAISFGYPLSVVRGHADFVPLYLVRSFLGEHRSSVAYLYQRMREIRGMNYGDYAYTEYYPGGMFSTSPPPGVARSQQAFRVWIRPGAAGADPLRHPHRQVRAGQAGPRGDQREGLPGHARLPEQVHGPLDRAAGRAAGLRHGPAVLWAGRLHQLHPRRARQADAGAGERGGQAPPDGAEHGRGGGDARGRGPAARADRRHPVADQVRLGEARRDPGRGQDHRALPAGDRGGGRAHRAGGAGVRGAGVQVGAGEPRPA
jgi:zinc protease